MTEDVHHNTCLTAALAEYSMLREEVRMFARFHRRDTQIVAGLLAVLGGLYLSDKRVVDSQVVGAVIPSLIFLYCVMQIINLHMVSVETKACARIEDRVNRLLCPEIAMDWESAIAREFIRGPYSPTPYATGAFLLLLIGIFAFFAVRTFESYGMFSLGIHAFELLVIAEGRFEC